MNEMVDPNKEILVSDDTHKHNRTLDFSFVLASSVHDMKNSLSMLLSSLEEVIRESSTETEEQKHRFSILQYEATRINTELVQLLSLYRFEQQAHNIKNDEHFIHDTIEDQIARNDMLFTTHNITVHIECDEDLAWHYDDDLLGSVIHTVLVNGVRYAKDNIHISVTMENDFLVIDIADDGRGFPSNMIDAASLDSEAHRDGNSTQLGLFFAAKIAALHQQSEREGSIQLFNGGALGGGVFRIRLP